MRDFFNGTLLCRRKNGAEKERNAVFVGEYAFAFCPPVFTCKRTLPALNDFILLQTAG